MKILFGVLASLLGMALVAASLAFSGVISVAADQYGSLDARVDSILNNVSRASIRRHAPSKTNPFADDRSAPIEGLAEFKENCVSCHGAGTIPPREFAAGLNPGAPALGSKEIQSMTDGELFWVISHGVRATGMPAFSTMKSEKEIWRIVAFSRHLTKLTEGEIQRLRAVDDER